ncbi:MAG TPA: PAS domain S-box protein [Nocardioidaceae bacterium]|nr:PAS domain S-box protein [Nocardioidaceae bacterium]
MHEDGNEELAVGPHAIFGLDAGGICTHSTGPALAHLGLRPGQLVGTDLFALYRQDSINVAALRRVLAGETFSLEREFAGRLLSTYFEPVLDPAGTVTGALGVTTDITEQRRMEGLLRAARERASLLADISAALGRDLLDLEALMRTIVRSVTKAVADTGVVWVRGAEDQHLVPGAAWHSDVGADGFSDNGLPLDERWPGQLEVSAVQALSGAQPFEVNASGETSDQAQPTQTRDTKVGLRVPLRSRDLLFGAIEIVRGPARGRFTQEEVDLVVEVSQRCAHALDHALLLRSEQESREGLVKFKALADASADVIAISDGEGNIVYANPRLDDYGIDLPANNAFAAATASVGERWSNDVRTALEAAGRWSGDVTLSTGSQETVGHMDVFRIFHPGTQAPLGAAWIVRDVTELRATEAALRGANADLKQFKALVEASPDFIAIADLDGKIKYVNPGGRRLIGMDPAVDVTTTTMSDYLTPDGLQTSLEVEQPAVIAQGHWEGESTLRNHAGSPIPVAIASFLVRDSETGDPFALATVQRDMSERLAAEMALRDLADQRQALLRRLVDAQDEERARIAADVHDDPVQALAAVDLRLGLLRKRLGERAPELLAVLEPLQVSVTGATDRLRALLFNLEPPDLQRGLTGALASAAEEIFESTETHWTVDGDHEPDVPDATRAIAYLISKEAMNNVRKHASAREVTVTIRDRDDGVEVTVADDGVGLGHRPEASPGHRGVFSMQDRAAVAGGRCTIRNGEQGGTVVTVWLPRPSSP